MIKSKAVSAPHYNYNQQDAAAPAKKVLRMVKSERMGGSIPVWEAPQSAAQRVEQRLGAAITGKTSPGYDSILDNVLTLQEQPVSAPPAAQDQEFGFADLVDMVNPLQHIPVADHLYRAMTGDTIKPISKLIGSSLFGGPLGAGGAVVNMIVERETGDDMTGNAFAMMFGDDGHQAVPAVPALAAATPAPYDNPEIRLSQIAALLEQGSGNFYNDLPGSAIAYADLGAARYTPEPTAAAMKPLHARAGRYNG